MPEGHADSTMIVPDRWPAFISSINMYRSHSKDIIINGGHKWLFSGPSNATMCYIIKDDFDFPLIAIWRRASWKAQNS
jgi:hypothetical protein